jgi:hypothetical protein
MRMSNLSIKNWLLALTIVIGCFGCRKDLSSEHGGSGSDWGEANNGLRIRIDVNRESNGTHAVTLFFQNANKQTLQMYQSWFWFNSKIECYNRETGRSAEPTPEGKKLFQMFSPGGGRAANFLVPLSPGQVYRGERVELEMVYQLTNGLDYHVSEIYEERLSGGWSGAVTSNVANVRAY